VAQVAAASLLVIKFIVSEMLLSGQILNEFSTFGEKEVSMMPSLSVNF